MILKNIDLDYEEIYQIYKEAFPNVERRTYEGQMAAMKRPDYRLLIRKEEQILAFLGYWDLPNCCFIEHLATTHACRGKGFGKDLVLECIKSTKKPIFLEIEPISEEDPMTARRAGFYKRLGFHCNSFPYLQMPLKEGDVPCTLRIMSYQQPLTEEEFLPYKREIYKLVYNLENGIWENIES